MIDELPSHIRVRPLGPFAQCADAMMRPFMQWCMGDPNESPQQTHAWNNRYLSERERESLNDRWMVCNDGMPNRRRFWPTWPFFHIPRLGGWKNYAVVQPTRPQPWHVGWLSGRWSGISRIWLSGPARVLIGPGDVLHFGVSAVTQLQIPIEQIGRGRIGETEEYKNLPLL